MIRDWAINSIICYSSVVGDIEVHIHNINNSHCYSLGHRYKQFHRTRISIDARSVNLGIHTYCTALTTTASFASNNIGELHGLDEHKMDIFMSMLGSRTDRLGQHASRHESIEVVPQQSHVSAQETQHS